MSLSSIYRHSLALLTDFYELTMAYGYWKTNTHNKEAIFHHFFRKKPFKGGFAIACGLNSVIEFVENFKYSTSDLDYLSSLKSSNTTPLFEDKFLHYLSCIKLDIDIDAVKEGTPIFPFEPLFRVKGSILHCQLLETPLLNLINFPTLIATKAGRLRYAAGNDYLMEFGIRRAQGIDGSITATRASFIGGVDATSNVIAGNLYDIPLKGTHAHSFVMSFDSEYEAFDIWQNVFPDNSILLVDTYDTINGIKNAIKIGISLKAKGKTLQGIRLDSGDLTLLSIEARKLLDDAGFKETKIYATNELDEYEILKLKESGAKITVWGVGTRLVTGDPQASLDGVYKLSAIKEAGADWQFKMKLSEKCQKISLPGILQVRRLQNEGQYTQDIVYCENHPLDEMGNDLLVPIFRGGKKVYQSPSLKDIKNYAQDECAKFHPSIRKLENPENYTVALDTYFKNLRHNLGEI